MGCYHSDLEGDSIIFSAFQRFKLEASCLAKVGTRGKERNWVLQSMELDFLTIPSEENAIRRAFDAVDTIEPFGILERKELFRWFELEQNLQENIKQTPKTLSRRRKLVGEICDPSTDDVTFEKFREFFKTWTEDERRKYTTDIVHLCGKEPNASSYRGDRFELNMEYDVQIPEQPHIQQRHKLTYNGFVSRTVARTSLLCVERIKWVTTRKNTGILRPMQKRVHTLTCTILNTTWRIRNLISERCRLPDILAELVMQYVDTFCVYGQGNLTKTDDYVKRTADLFTDNSLFEVSIRIGTKGRKLLVTLPTPWKLSKVLDGLSRKKPDPVSARGGKKNIIRVPLVHDDIGSTVARTELHAPLPAV
uniref:Uncharacterized protein n=1 Tax=Lotharella oceanica TaxID=641309 RepID=A0A7S2U3I7_9EUKA